MSEAKPNLSVFIVVDRGGDRHSVTADRMLTDGREVTFTVAGREVGSFFDPLSAQVSTPSVAPAELCALVPGEVCMTSFQSAPRGLVEVSCFVALMFAVSVGLKAYELFWFAG